jgi:hypothetical protein
LNWAPLHSPAPHREDTTLEKPRSISYSFLGGGARAPAVAAGAVTLASGAGARRGQISGIVRARDGKTYVVKGDTHKEKAVKVTPKHAFRYSPSSRAGKTLIVAIPAFRSCHGSTIH